MTPNARIAAAITILDAVLAGTPAEQALTGWARASRFAGSGDRAAIRDLVFDALRRRRSLTALSGAREATGRALMIGHVLAAGRDPASLFVGEGYAPPPLDAQEQALIAAAAGREVPDCVALDCPDWIAPALRRALGADMDEVLRRMRDRAPIYVRVNLARTTPAAAMASLAEEGILSRPDDRVSSALEVTERSHKLRSCRAYADGLVELQDLSPQAAVEALGLDPDMDVLDYCAGGGGKALAIAARGVARVSAHDANPRRMSDLPARAGRAGASIEIVTTKALCGRKFDLVITDVPCSGTGTWRRTPDAKWRLTPDRLSELMKIQAEILDDAVAFVAPGGRLVYMTCSLLGEENRDQIDGFLRRHPEWRLASDHLYTPLSGGDGFYSAHLTLAEREL